MWHFGIFFWNSFLLQHDRHSLKRTYLEVNEIDMFSEPCPSVELLSAEIADHGVLAVVMEHVSPQLGVLDELLAADVAFVISAAGVRSHVTIQGFLSSEALVAHRAAVRTLASMHAPGSYGI